uniref:Uncharacterized protein n=1 Tax=Oryza glumipatula TaxID=40148 RepID=A0A0D9Y819_9ORYZ
MLKRLLAAGVAPGVAAASELLRKASLVVLLVTVHAMAPELLGEDVVLVLLCVPELVPALLWFSLNIDRGSQVITVDKIKSQRNVLGAAAVAVLAFAYLAVSMDESGVSRCMMTSVSCGVSGLQVYYVVFMLSQWPAQGTGTGASSSSVSYLEEAIKLLKFWADILLVAPAALLVPISVAAVRLGLHEYAENASDRSSLEKKNRTHDLCCMQPLLDALSVT